MVSRLPAEAFEFYVGLGPSRSYQTVADHFGVTKKAVTNRAVAEGWADRVAGIERQARENGEKKAVESIEQLNERHLKILKALQGKALEALRNMPMTKTTDVIRALELSIRQERAIRGVGEQGVGIEVNVNNRSVELGPPVPDAEELGVSIQRLSQLARDRGLLSEEDDPDEPTE